MPLTNNKLPSITPARAVPYDVATALALSQTFTASGFIGNGGATSQVDLEQGRMTALWVIDIASMKISAGNEAYSLALLGSNDPAFGAGNVDLLAFHDWAAVNTALVAPALRFAPIAMPIPGESARRHTIPFSNAMGGFIPRYAQAYLTVAGTAPSIKLTSWIAAIEKDL